MPIRLSDFEAGDRPKKDARAALADVRAKLSRLHALAVAHGKSIIIALEGWEASPLAELANGLAAAFDPVAFSTSAAPEPSNGAHFLQPYWAALPGKGMAQVFLGSWYRRILDAPAGDSGVSRAFDEVNEFEALVGDHGTILIKLFLHVSEPTQRAQLAAILDDPERVLRSEYLDELVWREKRVLAAERMLQLSDTHWAPWHVFNANHVDQAVLEGLSVISERLAAKLPSSFPERDVVLEARARDLLQVPAFTDNE